MTRAYERHRAASLASIERKLHPGETILATAHSTYPRATTRNSSGWGIMLVVTPGRLLTDSMDRDDGVIAYRWAEVTRLDIRKGILSALLTLTHEHRYPKGRGSVTFNPGFRIYRGSGWELLAAAQQAWSAKRGR